jgi:hypothetical protein
MQPRIFFIVKKSKFWLESSYVKNIKKLIIRKKQIFEKKIYYFGSTCFDSSFPQFRLEEENKLI